MASSNRRVQSYITTSGLPMKPCVIPTCSRLLGKEISFQRKFCQGPGLGSFWSGYEVGSCWYAAVDLENNLRFLCHRSYDASTERTVHTGMSSMWDAGRRRTHLALYAQYGGPMAEISRESKTLVE
jgi:hypothetical protein